MATYSRQTSPVPQTGDTITAALLNDEFAEIYTALGAQGIGTVQLEDTSVTAAKLSSLSVETSKVANLAITAAKIANGTITTTQIASATILDADIAAAAAIALSKLATGAAEVEVGTFTGTGVQSLSGSFTPEIVLIWKQADGSGGGPWIKTSSDPSTNSKRFEDSKWDGTGITALSSGSFTTGTTTASGTWTYIAIGVN